MILDSKKRFELFTVFLDELWNKGLKPHLVCSLESEKPPVAYNGNRLFDLSGYATTVSGSKDIIFNVGTSSIGGFSNTIDEDGSDVAVIKMRFSGKPMEVQVPYDCIKVIYEKSIGVAIESNLNEPIRIHGISEKKLPETYGKLSDFLEYTNRLVSVEGLDNIVKFLPIFDEVARSKGVDYYIQLTNRYAGSFILQMDSHESSVSRNGDKIEIRNMDFPDEVFKFDDIGLVGENLSGDEIIIDNIFTIPGNNGESLVYLNKVDQELIIKHPGIIDEIQALNPDQEEEVTQEPAEVIKLEVPVTETNTSDTGSSAKIIDFSKYKKSNLRN